jgi:hypothetical protein
MFSRVSFPGGGWRFLEWKVFSFYIFCFEILDWCFGFSVCKECQFRGVRNPSDDKSAHFLASVKSLEKYTTFFPGGGWIFFIFLEWKSVFVFLFFVLKFWNGVLDLVFAKSINFGVSEFHRMIKLRTFSQV